MDALLFIQISRLMIQTQFMQMLRCWDAISLVHQVQAHIILMIWHILETKILIASFITPFIQEIRVAAWLTQLILQTLLDSINSIKEQRNVIIMHISLHLTKMPWLQLQMMVLRLLSELQILVAKVTMAV